MTLFGEPEALHAIISRGRVGVDGMVSLHSLKVPASVPLKFLHWNRGVRVGHVEGLELNTSWCRTLNHTAVGCGAVLQGTLKLADTTYSTEIATLLAEGLLGLSPEVVCRAEGCFRRSDGSLGHDGASLTAVALTTRPATHDAYIEGAKSPYWPIWVEGGEEAVWSEATVPEALRRGLKLPALTRLLE